MEKDPLDKLIFLNKAFIIFQSLLLLFNLLILDFTGVVFFLINVILLTWLNRNFSTFRVAVRVNGLIIYGYLLLFGFVFFIELQLLLVIIGSYHVFMGGYGLYNLTYNKLISQRFVN